MMRASPASEVMVPNTAASEMLRLGSPRFVWLKTLNASQRNVAATRLMLNRRARLRSKLCQPGPLTLLRGALPNVPEATAWNAAVLNHLSTVLSPSGSPTRLGRPFMFTPTLLLDWLTVNGRPERAAKMPETVQPPRMARPGPDCM